jgi:predicted aspartyl protease
MRAARPLLLLIALAVVAGGCGFAPGRAVIPRGGADVPLSLDDHQPAVDLLLNGRGPYRVLVDTGASPALAVSPQLAKELGLGRDPGAVRLRAANGQWVHAARTHLRSVRLGAAEFRQVPAVVLDVGGGDFAAVIGMGLFARSTVTFDFRERRLLLRVDNLSPDDPDAFEAPFVHGVPMVPVSPPLRNGHATVHVLLDTGSNGGLVLPEALREQLATDPTFTGRAVADTLGGTREIELVRLRGTLDLGHYATTDPVVGLAPGRGSIGTPVLRGLEVSIDQRSRRVRLKLAPRHEASDEPRR